MFINILNLIYPNVCGMCDEISKESICNKCKIKINKLIKANRVEYIDKYFNSHIYIFKYEGIIRDKLLQYKFDEKSYLYKFFAEIMLNNCNLIDTCDIILAVPIHKKRFIKRGYNQSELIARYLAKKLNTEYSNKVLIKVFNNKPQSTLNKTSRQANVLGMYKVINSQKIQNKNILLIDDIFTTGCTLNECAKVLKFNGAKSIAVLTVAKD